ncbi:MAG: xylose isomerase [Spirochaetales bacterium]
MSKDFFPDIPKIRYEGPESDNPFAFKFYDPDKVIAGKPMREHLRFSLAYWHTMTGRGADPFGVGTAVRPWDSIGDPMENAKARMRAFFEVLDKLGVDFFCFHDRDVAPDGATLRESNRRLDEIIDLTKDLKAEYKKELLWGTACLFQHPRYMHGAATSCEADVFAYAAGQVKKAMEVTQELGGHNYVFWGGREGYDTIWNTNMGLELDNMARFLRMAVDYRKKLGMTSQLLVEPKPKEPTAHQYDYDVGNILAFLRGYGLDGDFKINIEQNHAILAGHTFQHEIRLARNNGMLGSLDANQGDYLLGWDTDQQTTSIPETVAVMYEVLDTDGLAPGGMNFDAKLRRASFTPDDIFLGHIAAMDTWARGLEIADRIRQADTIDSFVRRRYSSFESGVGADISAGKTDFESLEKYIIDKGEPELSSGRREWIESEINRFM